MNNIKISAALSFAGICLLTACGGGGGGSSNPNSAATSSAASLSPSSASVSSLSSDSSNVSSTSSTISFANVSVHDPALIKVADTYYIFGSHLAAAKSTDLMNWTKIADGVTASNPLFNNVITNLTDTFKWTTVTDLWAPDIVKLGDGKFYHYYDSCQGSSPLSALGVAVADNVDGPYINKQIFLKSGGPNGQNLNSDGLTNFDVNTQPNVVDPNTFFDKDGNLWMMYGSFSGGIFILSMDKTTGLPNSGQGWGKHLIGGGSARIEGSYVLYSPETNYYYMFLTFGGLDANGGYNIRVSRSVAPDGPYYDANGNDMSAVKGSISNDSYIAPYGQKLMGNYQYALTAGESGTPVGYVSPGGVSPFLDTSTNQYFIMFHTRFPGTGDYFEDRVHQMYLNEEGWFVAAPFRYVPLSMSQPLLSMAINSTEIPGTYKYINHNKDVTATIKKSQVINLNTDGSVSGAVTGTWQYIDKGSNYIDIDLGANGLFHGVVSHQWNPNANAFEVAFTAQSQDGISIWGVRTGN